MQLLLAHTICVDYHEKYSTMINNSTFFKKNNDVILKLIVYNMINLSHRNLSIRTVIIWKRP